MHAFNFVIIILAVVLAIGVAWLKYHIERKKHRKRSSEALYSLIMDNSLLAAIGALLLLAILVVSGIQMRQEDLIDIKMLVTLLVTGIIGLILIVAREQVINKLEDSIKLSHDYEGLIKKYKAEDGWYKYDNSNADEINYRCLSKEERKDLEKANNVVKFPVIVDCSLENKRIVINDSKTMYELPHSIRPYENELFKAHDTSHLYNQLNVKVTDWKDEGDRLVINTGRTTYFKSMVTNRVMDFRMKNEMTVRDILQYGPFVPSLRESELSNHLGFNGFVITSDNMLPLVKRNSDMSIGKGTYGPSVGASLKTMYCLNENKEFTVEGLIDGIRKEIHDEMKIDLADLEGFTEDNIIAAYRDIVEGNKPQLLFCLNLDKTREEVQKAFDDALREKHKDDKRYKSIEELEEEDGCKLEWFDVNTLDKNLYVVDGIIRDGVRYESVPSATVSLLYAITYRKDQQW